MPPLLIFNIGTRQVCLNLKRITFFYINIYKQEVEQAIVEETLPPAAQCPILRPSAWPWCLETRIWGLHDVQPYRAVQCVDQVCAQQNVKGGIAWSNLCQKITNFFKIVIKELKYIIFLFSFLFFSFFSFFIFCHLSYAFFLSFFGEI